VTNKNDQKGPIAKAKSGQFWARPWSARFAWDAIATRHERVVRAGRIPDKPNRHCCQDIWGGSAVCSATRGHGHTPGQARHGIGGIIQRHATERQVHCHRVQTNPNVAFVVAERISCGPISAQQFRYLLFERMERSADPPFQVTRAWPPTAVLVQRRRSSHDEHSGDPQPIQHHAPGHHP